jgi:hypothetical protein
MSEICGECGGRKPQARKETLSRIKVEILMSAGRRVASTMSNRFKLKELDACNEPSHYNNFQKLRYHGLIAKVKVDGQLVRNEWCITRNGFRFLQGKIDLPKFVTIKNNHIVEKSETMLSLTDVWHGAPYLEASFEYFDDDNNAVGLRPVMASERQTTLV